MRFPFILVALAIVLSSRAEGQTRTLADTLEKLERDSWRAWQSHDGKFFEGFLSDDHVEVGFFGTGGKKTVVQGVAGGGCTVASYAVDRFATTRLAPNVAVVTYHAAQDTRCGNTKVPSPVWVSSVYVKRSGRWLNAVYQQTLDMRQPATK